MRTADTKSYRVSTCHLTATSPSLPFVLYINRNPHIVTTEHTYTCIHYAYLSTRLLTTHTYCASHLKMVLLVNLSRQFWFDDLAISRFWISLPIKRQITLRERTNPDSDII